MQLKPECIMTMCRETSIEAFKMQGRYVHPVASLHTLNLFLWASELLHCNSWAQSLCGIFYWFTLPRFFSFATSQACFLTFQSIWFSMWLQQVHSRSAYLSVLRRTFSLTFFFSSTIWCASPARPTHSVWLSISTLQDTDKGKIKLSTEECTFFILTERMICGSL